MPLDEFGKLVTAIAKVPKDAVTPIRGKQKAKRNKASAASAQKANC